MTELLQSHGKTGKEVALVDKLRKWFLDLSTWGGSGKKTSSSSETLSKNFFKNV